MADIKWIKIDADIFSNRKILQIETLPDGDAIIVIWLKLLTLAGNINDNGTIYFTQEIPYTDQMLASQFHRPLTTVQMALKVFQQFGMIEVIDELIHVSNWEKYQNVDRLNEIREYNRIAKQKSREKQKLLQSVNDKSMTSQSCHETDIDIDKIRKEEDKDKNKNIEIGAKSTRFVPPTTEEVKEYCLERNNGIDAQRFVDFYSAKGWMVGKNKMKDWKACVRTWESKEVKKAPAPAKSDNRMDVLAEMYERARLMDEEDGNN